MKQWGPLKSALIATISVSIMIVLVVVLVLWLAYRFIPFFSQGMV